MANTTTNKNSYSRLVAASELRAASKHAAETKNAQEMWILHGNNRDAVFIDAVTFDFYELVETIYKEDVICENENPFVDYKRGLMIAIGKGYYRIVSLLYKHVTDNGRLHNVERNLLTHAVKMGRCDMVEFLIHLGNRSHIMDTCVLLWAACSCENIEIFRLLLSHGADVHLKDGSALAEATRDHPAYVVKIILDHGASVRSSEYLENAINRGSMEIVKMLIEAGANLSYALNSDVAHVLREQFADIAGISLL